MELIAEKYKQTEIGIIPSDWEVSVVSKIGTINGRVGWKGYTKKDLRDNGPYAIGAKHIDKSNRLDLSEPTCLSMEKFIESPEIMVFKGDILIVQRGTIGKVTVIDKEIGDATINPSMLILRLKNIPFKYAFYYLISNSGQNQILLDTSSTGVPMITQKQVLNFQIPLPPTQAEQTAVATALSDADALITSLERLIEKKHAIKQGAMQKLLKPKEGWEVKKLGEIADGNKKWSFTGGPFGSNLKSSDYTETGVRIIQLQNIGDGVFNNESEVFTSSQKANELISCNIYPGEIILSKMGDPVARACIIPNNHERYLMCSDGIRLVVNEKENNTFFIYTYINSPVFRKLAENASTGSTRKRIGLTQLRSLELILPKLKEQTYVAEILSSMDTEITALEQKLAKYKMTKQGMMQELLTGKIRLIEDV